MQALEELDYLAALDNDGNLSEMGIIMSEFSLDPQMAKALLASCEFDCASEMLTIAAMLTGTVTTLSLEPLYRHLCLNVELQVVLYAQMTSNPKSSNCKSLL